MQCFLLFRVNTHVGHRGHYSSTKECIAIFDRLHWDYNPDPNTPDEPRIYNVSKTFDSYKEAVQGRTQLTNALTTYELFCKPSLQYIWEF